MQSTLSVQQKSLSWLIKRVVLPLGDLVRRQSMMQRLSFLEKAQWWSFEQIDAYRNELLANTIRIAGNEVPFYRSFWGQHGRSWRDVSRPEHLERLPVTTKSMMRPAYPHSITRDTGQRTYEASSSGSTGANFCVREDGETAGWYRASFLLALQWAGWQIGEPHIQTGMTDRRGERKIKDLLLQCHYVPARDLSDQSLDSTLDLLDRRSIKHLWGYPGSLHLLAERAGATGWNKSLQSVVTWGDNLYPHYRRTIEKVFGSRVFDTYGCGEGIQIAAQCGHTDHYHVHNLDVVAEFVDESGRPVRPGETGNIVLTRLHPGPMPLIRYAVGDVGISGGTERCPCGRGFELMKSIQGRDTDVIVNPSGGRFIVHFFTGILEYIRELASFQVVQKERDLLVIKVVPQPSVEFDRDLEDRIIGALRRNGLTDIRIAVEPVTDIPATPSGKRRFVVSELPRVFK